MAGRIITEEYIVSKVKDLMDTLYSVKRYSALARSMKKFAYIIAASFLMLIIAGMSADFLGQRGMLTEILTVSLLGLFVLIPVVGIILGVLFVQRKINSVKPDDWTGELSNGFPGALKILTELNWAETLEEIAIGKIGYAIYVVLKTLVIWAIVYASMQLVANVILALLNESSMILTGYLFTFLSVIIVFLLLGNDLIKRYKEIQALDSLLWELRWFSVNLRKVEFEA